MTLPRPGRRRHRLAVYLCQPPGKVTRLSAVRCLGGMPGRKTPVPGTSARCQCAQRRASV
jgi:hypothetical protein